MAKLPPSDHLDPRLRDLLNQLGIDAERVQIMSVKPIGNGRFRADNDNVIKGPWPPHGMTEGMTYGHRDAPSHRPTKLSTEYIDVLKVLDVAKEQAQRGRHDACIVITMIADAPSQTAVIMHSGLNQSELIGVLEGVKHDVMVRDDGHPFDAA